MKIFGTILRYFEIVFGTYPSQTFIIYLTPCSLVTITIGSMIMLAFITIFHILSSRCWDEEWFQFLIILSRGLLDFIFGGSPFTRTCPWPIMDWTFWGQLCWTITTVAFTTMLACLEWWLVMHILWNHMTTKWREYIADRILGLAHNHRSRN